MCFELFGASLGQRDSRWGSEVHIRRRRKANQNGADVNLYRIKNRLPELLLVPRHLLCACDAAFEGIGDGECPLNALVG